MVNDIDSFVVLGPGRTGSLSVVRSLYALYNYNDYVYCSPKTWPRLIEPNEVVHTHRVEWLDFVDNKRTQVIITTRDPVDSTISWFLKYDITQQWHFYANDADDIKRYMDVRKKTHKVYIDPDAFVEKYKEALNVYNRIELKPTYKIIDYNDWCDDPNKILPLLGYENFRVDPRGLILKNPGPHSRWIENWDELSKVLETLDRTIKYKT